MATCGIKHQQSCLQAASPVHYTTSCKQSSAPEDGRNFRPKYFELNEVINKLSLLHLVGCLYYYIYTLASRISVAVYTRNWCMEKLIVSLKY